MRECWGCKGFEGVTRRLEHNRWAHCKSQRRKKNHLRHTLVPNEPHDDHKRKNPHSHCNLERYLQLQKTKTQKKRPHQKACLPNLRTRISSRRVCWGRFA